ncbi:hypothetical protein LOTGIDRAFT_172317 [Lottia gigantea]|uniref:Uncharacterized protein n=1 Tax=Lottia gigantea TaxID=225164 RepID=V4B847_LOTGI|nr:hypothetical protein LOTGIDRAFT_172317 [Lottia gigantea]ESP01852.1 hypothetical protein LOTGIDRAFT_172317 [Lottia gigantea]
MANNMDSFLSDLKQSQFDSLSDIRKSQQEFLNSICDNERSSYNSDSDFGRQNVIHIDGASALNNLLNCDGSNTAIDFTGSTSTDKSPEVVENEKTATIIAPMTIRPSINNSTSQSDRSKKLPSSTITSGMLDVDVDTDLNNDNFNSTRESQTLQRADEFSGIFSQYSETARPENCQNLSITKVNKSIWDSLSSDTRSSDIKLQKVQQLIIKGLVPLTLLVQNFMESPQSDTASGEVTNSKDCFRMLTDSMALFAAANSEVNGRRQVLMKPDVNSSYRSLCTVKGENGPLLFGNDLPQRLRDISETNRVTSRVFGQQSRPYRPDNNFNRDYTRKGSRQFHPYNKPNFQPRFNQNGSNKYRGNTRGKGPF